ncbi:hypothetical protein HDU86_000565, partial [Geranomyces michiganensis]
ETGDPIESNLDVYHAIKESTNASSSDMKVACSILSSFKNLKNSSLRMELVNQMREIMNLKEVEIADDLHDLYSLIKSSSV